MSHSKPEVVNMARLTTSVDLTQLLPDRDSNSTSSVDLLDRLVSKAPQSDSKAFRIPRNSPPDCCLSGSSWTEKSPEGDFSYELPDAVANLWVQAK
jgi:hypothetical protein